MKKYKTILIVANLLFVLFLFNMSVMDKEQILDEGTLVLLRLAPVDPRSLMQGDYMQLDYEITRRQNTDSMPKRGYCILEIDSMACGSFLRYQKELEPLNEGEYAIAYSATSWDLHIGADSYFFEEGQSAKFDSAAYGGLKIDRFGNSVLVGLYNAEKELIE